MRYYQAVTVFGTKELKTKHNYNNIAITGPVRYLTTCHSAPEVM